MIQRLDPQTLEQSIKKLEAWALSSDKTSITKSFKFKDFAQCWAFMNKIAAIAEDTNHHPEWLNVYNRVDITLTTHDADGVTKRDIDMAEAINALAKA